MSSQVIPTPEQPTTNHTYAEAHPPSGTALFASKALEEGEVVLRVERPLLAVLDSAYLSKSCEWCFVCVEGVDGGSGQDEEVTLKMCKGCGVARYCGEVSWEICAVLRWFIEFVSVEGLACLALLSAFSPSHLM